MQETTSDRIRFALSFNLYAMLGVVALMFGFVSDTLTPAKIAIAAFIAIVSACSYFYAYIEFCRIAAELAMQEDLRNTIDSDQTDLGTQKR